MSPGSGAHGRVCGRRLRVQAWPLAVAVVAFVVLPVAAAGQTGERAVTAEGGQANPPAYVSAVDGAARIDREGRSEVLESGMPVAAGDRLRAENGRVEVTFADGSVVHLDRFADVDLVADTVLHLSRGRLLATIGETNATRISLEAPGASVRIDQPGQYRLTVGGTDRVEVALAVIRGSAQLSNDGGAVALNSGEESRVVEGEAPSAPQWLAASGDTALERWADERIATWRAPSTSRNYLPAELVSYGSTFDQYGSWQVDATYGSVWYPTVAVDWRPYYRGRWHHAPRWGWTWIAHDPWGWPTHHYGRWHISARGSWFWIPSRSWGSAWVYWATSPGYVGWCPLGWNGRPVLNVFTSYGHSYRYRGRDPWRAWTFVSHDRFGRGHVPLHRIDRVRLDRDRPSFAMQHVPPGYAPPRSPYGRYADRSPGRRAGCRQRRAPVAPPTPTLTAGRIATRAPLCRGLPPRPDRG